MKIGLLFNQPLGALVAPIGNFRPKRAVEVGGIVQGLGSLGAGVLNYFSQQGTNQSNRQIARETNAQNYKIWQEQLAAARDQYKQEVAENRFLVNQAYERSKPAVYKQQLLAAGINPAFAMQQGSFGSVNASTGSNPSASLPSAPEMQTGAPMQSVDYTPLGVGIGNAMSLYLQQMKAETDMAYINQKSQNETAETAARIENMNHNSKYLTSLTDSLKTDMLFNRDSWNIRLKNLQADFELKVSQQNLNKATEEVQKTIKDSNELENAFRRCTNPLRAQQMIADNLLIAAQRALALAHANSINELLPYQQNLMKNEFIHLMNQDAADFENIGISMKALGLNVGHANMKYAQDWVDPLFKGIGAGTGIWLGLKTIGRSPNPILGFR